MGTGEVRTIIRNHRISLILFQEGDSFDDQEQPMTK